MNCHQLAAQVEEFQPDATARDVARLCLLLSNYVDDLDDLQDESEFTRVWQEMGIRLQAATDQHAAMTAELEDLAVRSPDSFSINEVWVLIRAVKVQSQVLQLYVGQPSVDV